VPGLAFERNRQRPNHLKIATFPPGKQTKCPRKRNLEGDTTLPCSLCLNLFRGAKRVKLTVTTRRRRDLLDATWEKAVV